MKHAVIYLDAKDDILTQEIVANLKSDTDIHFVYGRPDEHGVTRICAIAKERAAFAEVIASYSLRCEDVCTALMELPSSYMVAHAKVAP